MDSGAGPRSVGESVNRDLWGMFPENVLFTTDGRLRDPYWESGCHPDIVGRLWDELGASLPEDCRARANGVPVLAHPLSERVFATARGTAYALWLTPADHAEALGLGASSVMRWSQRYVTDLRDLAGAGWIWGRWYIQETAWLERSYRAVRAYTGG